MYNQKSVFVDSIVLTRPTIAYLNSIGKSVSANDFEKVKAMELSDEDKAKLTFKVQFSQERENYTSSTTTKRVGLFSTSQMLKGHENSIDLAPRKKYDWMNAATLFFIEEQGLVAGLNFSEHTGLCAFILSENTLTPDFNKNGDMVSSPKRKGKGGNVLLTANDELIFQNQTLVANVEGSDFADFSYDDFVALEISLQIKSTKEIASTDVPDEGTRNSDGTYAPSFQQWLHATYNKETVLTEV